MNGRWLRGNCNSNYNKQQYMTVISLLKFNKINF